MKKNSSNWNDSGNDPCIRYHILHIDCERREWSIGIEVSKFSS